MVKSWLFNKLNSSDSKRAQGLSLPSRIRSAAGNPKELSLLLQEVKDSQVLVPYLKRHLNKLVEDNLFVDDYDIERIKSDARAELALQLLDFIKEIEDVRLVDQRS